MTESRYYVVTPVESTVPVWYHLTGNSEAVKQIHKIISAFYAQEQNTEEPTPLTAWILEELTKIRPVKWSKRIDSDEARVKFYYYRIQGVTDSSIRWSVHSPQYIKRKEISTENALYIASAY